MAVTVTVATPTWGNRAELNSSYTSASFNVVAGELLVLALNQDGAAASTAPTNTGTAFTWTRRVGRTDYPMHEFWTAVATVSQSMTVTLVTTTGGGQSDRWFGHLYRVTGYNAASTFGATAAPSPPQQEIYNLPVTTTANDSVMFVNGYEYQERGLPTSSDLTYTSNRLFGWTDWLSGYKIVPTAGATTCNLDGGDGSAGWIPIALEIHAAPVPVWATDDFNRANGAVGSNWTQVLTAPTIAANKWHATGFGVNYWHEAAASTDQTAEIEWDGVGGELLGPIICASGTDWQDGYSVWLPDWSEGFVQLRKNQSTTLATNAASGWETGTPFTCRLRKSGTNLKVFINDVEVIDHTDSTPLTGLRFGFGSGGGTNFNCDNFAGGDLAAEPLSYTMFGSSMPTAPTFVDNGGVELCTKFYVTVPGNITALRAPRRGSASGVMRGYLYNAAGVLQRSVTFPTGADRSWMEVAITPFPVVPDTLYAVSYWKDDTTDAGSEPYYNTAHYFDSEVLAPGFVMPCLGSTGGLIANGTFRYDPDDGGTLPSGDYNNTCYYADVVLTTSEAAEFTPAALPGLVGWWDASDAASFAFYSGAVIQQWSDKSGTAHHLTTGSSTTAPVRGMHLLNGLPTVTTDSVDDYLRHVGSNIITGNTLSVCALLRVENFISGNNRLISFNKSGETDYGSSQSCIPVLRLEGDFPVAFRNSPESKGTGLALEDTWVRIDVIWDGVNNTLYIDGVAQTPVSSAYPSFDIDEMWFGRPGFGEQDYANASYAEIIVTSAALDATQRGALEDYFQAKWFGAPAPTSHAITASGTSTSTGSAAIGVSPNRFITASGTSVSTGTAAIQVVSLPLPATFFAAGTLAALATGTSITATIPASTVATRDVAIAVFWYNASTSFTTPSGWTLLGTTLTNAALSVAFFWKRLAGGDANPATTVTTMSATNGGYGRVYVWRDVGGNATPFEDIALTGAPTSSTTPGTTATTTDGPSRQVVAIAAVDDDPTWSSGMPPAGWTNVGPRVSSTTGGDGMTDAIQILASMTGQTVAAVNMGTMSAAANWRVLTLAIAPARLPLAASGLSTSTGTAAIGVLTPNPPIATLTDTFDSAIDKAVKWIDSSPAVVWEAGRAKVPVTSSYWAMQTALVAGPAYNLTNSAIFAKIVVPANGNNSREVTFTVFAQGGDPQNNLVRFLWQSGTLICRKINATTTTDHLNVAYSATNHAWLRIRHAAGTVYWDASADGTNWTNLASTTAPTWDITKTAVGFGAGYWGTESASDAFVDYVNVPAPVSHAITASGTGTSSGSAAITITSSGPVLFSDNFNRANGAVGANWDTVGDGAAPVIASNALVQASTADTNVGTLAWQTPTTSFAQFSQATITFPTLGSNDYAGLYCRTNPNLVISQSFFSMRQAATSANIEVRRYTGTGTTIATAANTLVAGVPQQWRMEMTAAGVITCYVNGVLKMTVTDDSLHTANYQYVGIGIRGTATADNWFGGDTAAAPTARPITASGISTSSGTAAITITSPAPSGPTLTVRTDGGSAQSASTSNTTASFTPTANSTLYFFGWQTRNDHTQPLATTVTGGGLTWTKLQEPAIVPHGDIPSGVNYAGGVTLWSAPVGASPSAMTINYAPAAGFSYYTAWIVFDVINGFIVASSALNETEGYGDTESITASLSAAAMGDNLVVALVGANNEGGSDQGFANPAGWTSVVNQTQRWNHAALWTRTGYTGTDFTCTDLGNSVGNAGAVLLELSATAPSVIYTDDFNRANTTAPGLGAAWNAPAWYINGNVARRTAGDSWSKYATAMPGPDHWIELDIAGALADNRYCDIAIRCQNATAASDDCYVLWLDPHANRVELSTLGPTVGYNNLASFSVTHGGVGKLRLEAEGSNIRGWLNGTKVIDITDTLVTTGSYVGLTCRDDTGASISIDNFRAGSLPYTSDEFTPAALPGLVGWWDAADAGSFSFYSGAAVQQWNDLSGTAHHLTTTSGTAPTRGSSTLNSLDTVTFNGLDSYIKHDGSNIITGTTLTLTAVVRPDGFSGSNNRYASFSKTGVQDFEGTEGCIPILKLGDNWPVGFRDGMKSAHSGVGLEDTWVIVSSVFDGTNHTMYIDGVAETPVSSTGTFDIDEMWFGKASSGGEYAIATFAEIVVTNTALDATQRGDLEDYLTEKWFGAVGPTSHAITASGTSTSSGSAAISIVTPPPQTWTGGSIALIGVAGQSGAFTGGAVTWVGSVAQVGIAGQTGLFIPAPVTWVGSTAQVGVAGQTGLFIPSPVTWVGSTAQVGVAGITGAFVPGAVVWVGSPAAVGIAGQSGEFFTPALQVWVGSAAQIGVAGQPGAFAAGSLWTGSDVQVGVAGQSDSFTGGPVTWAGSTAQMGAAGQSGSFSTGTAVWTGSEAQIGVAGQSSGFTSSTTWVGSTAQLGASGQSGLFVSNTTWVGSTVQIGVAGQSAGFTPHWVGSIAQLGVAGQSGTMVGGATTWVGSVAQIGVFGVAGTFASGGTWPGGSTAQIGVAGQSGAFVPASVTWVGSVVQLGVAGQSGTWIGGATTWVGSIAQVGVAGQSGAFAAGALVWAGSTAQIGVAGTSALFVAGAFIWIGSTAEVGIRGQSGAFVPGGTVWVGSVAHIGVNGVSGAWFIVLRVFGQWNGQNFEAMQYGDKAVTEWMMAPA